jgi:hypothetical protein
VENYTSNLSGKATFDLTPSINSQTQFGFQYKQSRFEATAGFGKGLVSGTNSLRGVTRAFFPNEQTVDDRTRGLFVSEQLSFNDRLFVTGSLRGDKNNAFGADFGTAYYPSIGASWVINEEPFFPQLPGVSSLRLRTSYGQSGLQPGARDAIAFFNPVTGRVQGGDVPAITIGQLANPGLKPERVREIEGGFDLGMLADRLNLEATYYDKRSSDALVQQLIAPSVGGPTQQLVNLGSVSNKGLELLLSGTILDQRNFAWNATVATSWNKNELLSLGSAQSDTIIVSADQRHVVGFPLGGYWGKTVQSYSTTTLPDGSVVVDPESIVLSDVHYLGNPLPTRQASISTDVTLFKWLQLSTLFEHQGGNKLDNATEEFRCGLSWICKPLVDKNASLKDQANAFAVFNLGEPEGAFIEDASFWKWRELSATLIGSPRIASMFRASAVHLTFAARNLHTWTKYSGLDPEVNYAGQTNFFRSDFLTQPQIRRYTVRLNLTY